MTAPAARRRLDIARTWEGELVGLAERAAVSLEARSGELAVAVDSPFHGDPSPPAPVGSTDRLWEHEVVELFVLGAGERYTEIELGPHGHYLVLRLEGRRKVVEGGLPLDFTPVIADDRWRVELLLPAAFLPPAPHAVNAFAIHGTAGSRRYLAHAPAGGSAPDFHRLEAFVPVDLGLATA